MDVSVVSFFHVILALTQYVRSGGAGGSLVEGQSGGVR